jgi:uncharacterized membrane protein
VASDSSGRDGGRAEEPASAPAEPAGAPADAPARVLGGVNLDEPLRLVGTEPFWGLDADGDTLRLSGADRKEQVAPDKGPVLSGDTAVWTSRTADGAALKVTLVAKACSDGMSDRSYPLTATVEIGGETLKGCGASAASFAMPKG